MPGSDERRWIDLSGKPVLAQLFAAFVAARLEGVEQRHSRDELVDIGWPGEKISPDAATNRLHVALSKLRLRHGPQL